MQSLTITPVARVTPSLVTTARRQPSPRFSSDPQQFFQMVGNVTAVSYLSILGAALSGLGLFNWLQRRKSKP